MANRQNAVLVYKSLNDKQILNKKIGENAKVKNPPRYILLVCPIWLPLFLIHPVYDTGV
jgi:hypothetical protein